MTTNHPRLALGIIARNEDAIIDRCIRSAAPYISEIFVLDSGDTVYMEEQIADTAADLDITCTVIDAEWENFGTARTKLMRYVRETSKCEWLLQIDADWVMTPDDNTGTNPFTILDDYTEFHAATLTIYDKGLQWGLPMLTRVEHPWVYQGKVHEFLTDNDMGGVVGSAIPGIKAVHVGDGMNREGRVLRDIELLKGEDDTRSLFYYAQSLKDAGRYEDAAEAYKIRANRADGWDQETYWSLLQVARCYSELPGQRDSALAMFLRAWAYRPTRIEALCNLAEIFAQEENWSLSYTMAELAVQQSKLEDGGINDNLFVERHWWKSGAMVLLITAAQKLGKIPEMDTPDDNPDQSDPSVKIVG